MTKAIIKFNNGNLALLCSKCRKILKEGYEFNELEKQYSLGKAKLKSQYCNDCKNIKTK